MLHAYTHDVNGHAHLGTHATIAPPHSSCVTQPNVNDLEDGEFINIRVMQQDGAELQFKIKRKTPMRKLMDAWCKKRVCCDCCKTTLFHHSAFPSLGVCLNAICVVLHTLGVHF